MTKLLLSAVLLVGCAKANDLSRLEDEAVATAAEYGPTVRELDARANEIRKLGIALAPDAKSKLADAQSQINSLKGKLAGTTRENIERNNPKGDQEFVEKRIDNVESELREGIINATDLLGVVETWISAAERGTPQR